MYKVLLATHGELGQGLVNTLKMFTSDIDHVHYVSLDESGVENFREKITNKMEDIYVDGEGILILADLFGGTPFNIASAQITKMYDNVKILSGVNLPMLIEACLMKDMNLDDIVDGLVEAGNISIRRFEASKCDIDEDDE